MLSTLNLKSFAKGVKPGINRNDIYKIIVSIPPISEQKQIVAVLDDLNERTRKLEENYKKQLYNLEELKKVFLERLFKGELK